MGGHREHPACRAAVNAAPLLREKKCHVL
jgi:hypothetical protein